MSEYLEKKIESLNGVGPKTALLLRNLNLVSLLDLLEHYPRDYEDRTQLLTINQLQVGHYSSLHAEISKIQEHPQKRLRVITMIAKDHTGELLLKWYNQPYIMKAYKTGMHITIHGKIEWDSFYNRLCINKPSIDSINTAKDEFIGSLLPVYSIVGNLRQSTLRKLMLQALAHESSIPETLPQDIIFQHTLISRVEALNNIHFPQSYEALNKARRRLIFEELFFLQYGLTMLKKTANPNIHGIKHKPDGLILQELEKLLPFTLTDDQQQVLAEIKSDMQNTTPMQRLLQGDVGSGKTIVAAIALAKTVENGYQGLIMAPTEILAEQHFTTLHKLFNPLGIKTALLTGKLSPKLRKEILEQIADGTINIIAGTHALIQEAVHYKNVGLVVTDEQHRFGVKQRAKLQDKGHSPDVLVMTATPIPRTMALTIYGDLDISTIQQIPPGRKPIRTFLRNADTKDKVYQFAVDQVKLGRQAYIVCPLVDASDKIEAQAASTLYEDLKSTYFNNISCGLLHGKMKPADKTSIMDNFYQGDIKILIATTVIEVGVNVPNATVMIVEDAERFGLAQLHQLRGRIGRGCDQSYCILIANNFSSNSQERLRLMTNTTDGFVLAEEDLKLRGPGHFFGTRQHGLPDLKLANILTDIDTLFEVRQCISNLCKNSQRVSELQDHFVPLTKKHFHMIFCN